MCLPDPAPALPDALRLLESRPNDSYLNDYILRGILKCGSLEIVPQAHGEVVPQPARALAARAIKLMPELAATCPEALKPAIDEYPDAPAANTGLKHALNAGLRANIHQHKSLPRNHDSMLESEYRDHWQKMQNRRGILKGLRDTFGPERSYTPVDPRLIYEKAQAVLHSSQVSPFGEMRHEASLSPIALLRNWNLSAGMEAGRNAHRLEGQATAYGRGLSLVQARVSCAMEIIERASAHAYVTEAEGSLYAGKNRIIRDSWENLTRAGYEAVDPCIIGSGQGARYMQLHWIKGERPDGKAVYLPCQAVYLFSNFDENDLSLCQGSTGLAASSSMEAARLGALIEIIERYSHASMPFTVVGCFELASRDKIIQSLLDDYRWRGIRVQFQDITSEIDVPAYRCFVQGMDGKIAQSTGASLNGAKAALAALTETPWPYSWANPVPAPSGRGLPDLPIRFLEDLPDFSMPSPGDQLALLEKTMEAMGIAIAYADLSRQDFGFPVCRAIAEGLEIDPELERGPGPALLARTIFNQKRQV